MIANCPHCRIPGRHPDEYVGREVICSSCKKPFVLVVNKQAEEPKQEDVTTVADSFNFSSVFMFFGSSIFISGVIVICVSLGMPTTISDLGKELYNIGLIDQRRTVLLIGCTVEIVGSLFLGFGYVGNILTSKK